MTVLLLAALSADVAADSKAITLGELRPDARIVLIRPDIRMFVISSRGTPKARADWAEEAQRSFVAAVQTYVAGHALKLAVVDAGSPADPDMVRYGRLFTVVADSIMAHHIGNVELPTKGTTFDWSLGPDVAAMGQRYDADYGLFVAYRGYHSSSAKWRDQVVGGVVLRVPTGSDLASAALVDMRSGDIVWFNPVSGTGVSAGDLRNPERARMTVELLLDPWPGHPLASSE